MSVSISDSTQTQTPFPNAATWAAVGAVQAVRGHVQEDTACLTAILNAASIDTAVMADGSYVFTPSSRMPRAAEAGDRARFAEIGPRYQDLINLINEEGVDLSHPDIENIQEPSLVIFQLLDQIADLHPATRTTALHEDHVAQQIPAVQATPAGATQLPTPAAGPAARVEAVAIFEVGVLVAQMFGAAAPAIPVAPAVDRVTAAAIANRLPYDSTHDPDRQLMIRLLTAASMHVNEREDGTYEITPNNHGNIVAVRQDDLARYEQLIIILRDNFLAFPQGVDMSNPVVRRISRNRAILVQMVQAFQTLPGPVATRLRTVSVLAEITPIDAEFEADLACLQRLIVAAGVTVDIETIQKSDPKFNTFTYPPLPACIEDIARLPEIYKRILQLGAMRFQLQRIDQTDPIYQKIIRNNRRVEKLYNTFNSFSLKIQDTVLRRRSQNLKLRQMILELICNLIH